MLFIDNDPVCKVNKENIMAGESLQMECVVDYTGSIPPVIKWSRSDGIIPESNDNKTICSVVSKLTKRMTIEDNGVTFKSNIYFNHVPLSSNGTIGVHKAINAPNYTFVWTHNANVLCKYRSS